MQEASITQSGVMLQTAEWHPHSVRYLLARGAFYGLDGNLCFRNPDVEEIAHKIEAAHAESSQGIFIPDRENDELSWALGNKEHPGRTRGSGVVSWLVAFEEDKGTYRSRKRTAATRKAEWGQTLESSMQGQID